jgi:hypothetical protein
MTPFPLPITELFTKFGEFSIYILIGFAFGFVLEISGFANSPKLAAQFYFKDLTVLKVMFTAIVVAMVLVFGASAVACWTTTWCGCLRLICGPVSWAA